MSSCPKNFQRLRLLSNTSVVHISLSVFKGQSPHHRRDRVDQVRHDRRQGWLRHLHDLHQRPAHRQVLGLELNVQCFIVLFVSLVGLVCRLYFYFLVRPCVGICYVYMYMYPLTPPLVPPLLWVLCTDGKPVHPLRFPSFSARVMRSCTPNGVCWLK